MKVREVDSDLIVMDQGWVHPATVPQVMDPAREASAARVMVVDMALRVMAMVEARAVCVEVARDSDQAMDLKEECMVVDMAKPGHKALEEWVVHGAVQEVVWVNAIPRVITAMARI
jgi:hypothetical protein